MYARYCILLPSSWSSPHVVALLPLKLDCTSWCTSGVTGVVSLRLAIRPTLDDVTRSRLSSHHIPIMICGHYGHYGYYGHYGVSW